MSNKEPITIECERCGQEFVWTVGEQEFYEEKGLEQPTLCVVCRAIKKAEQEDKAQYNK